MLTSESFFGKKQLKTGVIITISTEKCTEGFSKKVVEFILISLPLFIQTGKKSSANFSNVSLLFSKDGGKYTQSITIYGSHLNDSFLRIRSTSNLHKMHQSIQTLFPKVCHYYSEDFAIVSASTYFST